MESPDRGFIFGASEDGTLYHRKSRNQYTIEIEQKVKEWLTHIQEILLREYSKGSNLRKTNRGYHRLIFYSKEIYQEILDFRNDYRKLYMGSRDFQIAFLQGIFDAEGTVHNKRFQIRISSNRKELIQMIDSILNDLGISTGKIHEDTAVSVLPLYGKDNLLRFQNIIGFRHPEKKQRLSDLLS